MQTTIFNLKTQKNLKEALLLYVALLGITIFVSIICSLAPVFQWGNAWHSDSEERLKMGVAATHAVCSLLSFIYSFLIMENKSLKTTNDWMGAVFFALLSGAFASPIAPIYACFLSTRK
ncbi:MAG: hypothetical protein RLZZ292_3761 [Bacteroidota bacterium]|jgi:Na+/H+-translocating membrane pyrophosphatase